MLKISLVPRNHVFNRLTAYIDSSGIIRVGGRLLKTQLAYHSKHLAILPRSSQLTSLIIRNAHLLTLHGGTQLSATHSAGILDHLRPSSCQVTHFKICYLCKVLSSTGSATHGAITHGQGYPIITCHSHRDRLCRANHHKLMERSWIQNVQMLDLYLCVLLNLSCSSQIGQ